MKTYRQDLAQSWYFIITIISPAFIFIFCLCCALIFQDITFLKVIWPILLFAIGIMLLNFSQLWYIAVDEEEFWINNGIFGFSENLFRYETLHSVNFGYSAWYGFYSTVYMNDNRKKTYTLMLVKKSDVKEIVKSLQEHGVNVNTTKLPEKYK